MDFSDSLGELPLSRLCSPNRTSASCPSLPRYQAACVSILCGSARAVARITCAADSGGGTRERISLRPPDPHSPWHDAITQQSGRFTGDPEVTELSGRRRRAVRRWPPSAAQTARAVFPHAAFTKTHDRRCKEKQPPSGPLLHPLG